MTKDGDDLAKKKKETYIRKYAESYCRGDIESAEKHAIVQSYCDEVDRTCHTVIKASTVILS